jgi:hypothetical protein
LTLNFKPWDELLHRYVDRDGKVDYHSWQNQSRQQLTDWLEEIGQINLQNYPKPDEKLALWLNLYNAIAIAQVLKVYPIATIRPTILGIPNWIAFFRFFQHRDYQISDRTYSLEEIEHKIIRPTFNDPRIHFALVCAAVGCPLLRNEAYLPESVQAQLEDDAKRFINNPTKVNYDASSQTLYCSRIFQWYRRDFLKVADSVAKYIQNYLSGSLKLPDTLRLRYLTYDWRLNQQIPTQDSN